MGNRYLEMEIQTATPAMLIVKLYEGAIRHARRAQDLHGRNRFGERGQAISRSLAIVGELQDSLDLEKGGEIADNLRRLYWYVSDRLLDASVSGRMSSIDEAMVVLETLHGAWAEIARSAPVCREAMVG